MYPASDQHMRTLRTELPKDLQHGFQAHFSSWSHSASHYLLLFQEVRFSWFKNTTLASSTIRSPHACSIIKQSSQTLSKRFTSLFSWPENYALLIRVGEVIGTFYFSNISDWQRKCTGTQLAVPQSLKSRQSIACGASSTQMNLFGRLFRVFRSYANSIGEHILPFLIDLARLRCQRDSPAGAWNRFEVLGNDITKHDEFFGRYLS